jgi:hypothetical protein
MVEPQTTAGTKALQLAKTAGVDFQSMDSLRIMRLSQMLKRSMEQAPGKEAVDFPELREACASERGFVELVDERLVLREDTEDMVAAASGPVQLGLMDWARGGVLIHREGATQAPWDCKVDVLMEWVGEPLHQAQLEDALEDVMRKHPLLRVRASPDDTTDALLGDGSCDISTVAAATWALICTVWQRHCSWGLLACRGIRRVVAAALWHCWPRTLVLHPGQRKISVPFLREANQGDGDNVADVVHGVLRHDSSWWNSDAMFNACVVCLDSETGSTRQFLYASTSHKYTDGGAAGALVRALVEALEGRLEPCLRTLDVQQARLRHYLQGEPLGPGQIDSYFQDINAQMFSYGWGQSMAVQFEPRVCDLMRTCGQRIAASEEIAWLACMVIALFRLMPDEKLIKILMVHNGRVADAEGGLIACTSQYVLLSVPAARPHSNTPLADIACRVKYLVSNNKFTRPEPCEQTHAKINIGGMVGQDGNFKQHFKYYQGRKPGWSRAGHVLQLRMDNEGGTWCVKDFKMNEHWDAKDFWRATVGAAVEIAEGWFTHALR